MPDKILIAEDDAMTARYLMSLLKTQGYQAEWVADGEAALASIRKDPPALILSDLVMPYRDGYQILRELRSDPIAKKIPVILMSAQDREEYVVRALDEGASDYVVKPFGAREMLARIRKCLRNASGEVDEC